MEALVTGRAESLFQSDLLRFHEQMKSLLADSSVLVIGAAGSIGGTFAREIASYPMRALHLVDISENNLAEVVRDLRSSGTALPADFATLALDFTAPEMRAYLKGTRHDYVFNFSALKHVRSERDPYTLMRMLITNAIGNDWLLDCLSENPPHRFFSVSSDKAVRPANLMGASKAFMERVLLSRSNEVAVSSARFANVAYSDGSLLHGFNQRITKRQPLSAPADVRRYFISHREAAQLCILSAIIGNNREVFYPKMFTTDDVLSFAEIARLHLRGLGLEPVELNSDQDAITFMAKEPLGSKRWACHFSESNTTGEKMCEEFRNPAESADLQRMATVGIITEPLTESRPVIEAAISDILKFRNSLSWTKEDLLAVVSTVVPELRHIETHRNLDQKM